MGIGNNGSEIPNGFNLAQNFPNPFNPSTTIEFSIPEKNNVSLKIYNMNGQVVTMLVNGEYSAGTHKIQWNATDFASGVYFYTLNTNNFSQTKRLVLIK